MDVFLGPLVWLITTVIDLFIWVIIIGAVLSWLMAFNVVNRSNRFVYMVEDFTRRLTEPLARPIRNILPNMGGIDLAPLVVILLLIFAKQILLRLYASAGY